MPLDSTIALPVAAILLMAGFVKGVIGFGLPSVGMGLLSLMMSPGQAAALLLLPNVVTNIAQATAGGDTFRLARSIAPLLAGTLVGIAATEVATGGSELKGAVRLLGLTLAVYALLGLFSIRFAIPEPRKTAWGWIAGLATGAMTALTGVYIIPSGPYLQAIGLEKNELVQAMGLSFIVASAGLGLALWTRGALGTSDIGVSALALIPAYAAMIIGWRVRRVISEAAFRKVFQISLLVLGSWLAIKG